MSRTAQLEKLSGLCLENAESLLFALRYCATNGIGCFRIGSSILPVKTHPQTGYTVAELPQANAIIAAFERCGAFARENSIRTVFHPDQFVVLNSPRADVIEKSIEELEYHAEVSEWVGADVINIHAGGAYGDKTSALRVLAQTIDRLPDAVRSRLTFENDDKTFSPADLLPFCRATSIPFVYDAHHHRCLPDGLSIEDATGAALETWNREPLTHISSPLEGWTGPQPYRHHGYIDVSDFPNCWRSLSITVEVEAKAKELAVLRLQKELAAASAPSSAAPQKQPSPRKSKPKSKK